MNSSLSFDLLCIIPNPKGDIRRIYPGSSPHLQPAEIYSTDILPGETKGWKCHTQMTCRIIPCAGITKFVVIPPILHECEHPSYASFTLSLQPDSYGVLTIPPMHTFAFQSLGPSVSTLLNLSDMIHDPGEAINLPLTTYPYNW